MKESVEQIVERYKANPTRANMQQIAKDNGCTMHEIGEFLKNANKKPGRPKTKAASGRKKSSSETTKKDTTKKVSSKKSPEEGKMLAKTYLIPPIMVSVAKEKAAEYRRIADVHRQRAKELELQAIELEDFLNGGFWDGEEE